MDQNPLILIVIFAVASIVMLCYGLYLFLGRRKAILADRLETYAGIEEEAALALDSELQRMPPVQRFFHTLLGRGFMQRVADDLLQADIPMRPSEYILLRVVLAAGAFLVGWRGLGYMHSGVILAVAGFYVPAIVVRIHQNNRRAKFVRQLADALMLLTNSLRSGYSFLKGLELVAKEMDDPISKELNRMLREVNLGATVDAALTNLGRRVNSPDMDIVISAYLVQKDIGGNLTEIMEKVAETIRERLRIYGDIKVLTAQGRLSALIVGLLPFALFLFLFLRSPSYFKIMIEDPRIAFLGMNVPLGVMMAVGAIIWQLIGGYIIHKIISIKV